MCSCVILLVENSRLRSLMATGTPIACLRTAEIFGFSRGPRITPLYTSPNAPSPSSCSTMTSSVEISHSSRIGPLLLYSPVSPPPGRAYGSSVVSSVMG